MKRSTLYSLCCVAFAMLPPAAGAVSRAHENSVDALFNAMDQNRDGKLSMQEHAAGVKKMFDTMDANMDGKVTATEMDAKHEEIAGQKSPGEMSASEKIKEVDANGDGVLTLDEHVAGARRMFERMDADRDGFVTKAEMGTGHAKLMRKGAKGNAATN